MSVECPSTALDALVVDDDALIRADLDGILSIAGFQCYNAAYENAGNIMLPQFAESIILLFSGIKMLKADGSNSRSAGCKYIPADQNSMHSGRSKPPTILYFFQDLKSQS